MNLSMYDNSEGYKSPSQKVRVITEKWVEDNLFCPFCGSKKVNRFEAGKPVADFYCPVCKEEYELKSKGGAIKNKIADGAYNTMIERIESINNPSFFFMNYNKEDLSVIDFIIVPKYFLSPYMIEKRKPLSENARRAGWIGCNILVNRIPKEGRLYIVKESVEQPKEDIFKKIEKTRFIKGEGLGQRLWILDILDCVNQIPYEEFTLSDMYRFEECLACKHPENHHIKPKIRQQLQRLRDEGLIEFNGRGSYRKVWK